MALSVFARGAKILKKRLYTLHIRKKIIIWVIVMGNEVCFNASAFLL